MKALIIYLDNAEEPAHSEAVQTAFEAGGGVNSDLYQIAAFDQSVVDYARNNGYASIIYSYSGISGYINLAENNPDIMIFMPTHGEDLLEKQQMVVTECGNDLQGGYYEFRDDTQSADSFSNGYICGQLFDIADQRSSTLQEARAAADATLDTNNIINVANAVAHVFPTKLNVGTLTVERTTNFRLQEAL